jgi:hypothetical protein
MTDYFDNPAIGSTLLARFMDHQDKALKEVSPTGFMEMGRMFEDLIEEEVTGSPVFFDKYFKSDMNLGPESAAWKKILPLFERDDPPTEDEIEKLYVWNTAPSKETGEIELNGTHKNLHRALDQIVAHDFRRLVPKNMTDALTAMLANFKRTETHESGAACRMKSDIEVFWEVEGKKHGMNIDLKATANFGSFVQNWKKSYIWQFMHYSAGFRQYCLENNITPHKMQYVISESAEPYLINIWDLSDAATERLKPKYNQGLTDCQVWLDGGKPTTGFKKHQTVDRWGREVNF